MRPRSSEHQQKNCDVTGVEAFGKAASITGLVSNAMTVCLFAEEPILVLVKNLLHAQQFSRDWCRRVRILSALVQRRQ